MTELFEKSIRVLELPQLLERLSQKAVSEAAKERALRLTPSTDADDMRRLQDETDAARALIGLRGSPSFSGVKDVREALARAERGGMLNPRELLTIAGLLTNSRRVREYYEADQGEGTVLDRMFDSLHANRFLEDKITTSILSEDEISGRLTCVGSTLCLRDRHADLGINIRYPVQERDERLTDSIATACAQHGFVMDLERVSAPNHFPLNHPAVQKLTELYNQETGQDSKPYAMAGGTYARKLPNAFAYGPGFPGGELPKELFSPGHGGAHGPDEALDLDRLLRALKIYIKAILLLDEMEL